MRRFIRRARKDQRGQGMTEYIIIVALIAIAAIAVITLFGDNIRALFAGASDALSGDTNVKVKTSQSKSQHINKGLKNFATGNNPRQ
jgi:pilus assembly protein Flp/PilA